MFVYLLLAFLQKECETGCNKLHAYKRVDRKRKSVTATAQKLGLTLNLALSFQAP